MSFPQGPPPSSVLKDDDKTISWGVYQAAGDGKGDRPLLLRGQAPELPVRYEGSSVGADSAASESDYWIGVFNKKDNSVELIPTPTLFKMRQYVAGQENDTEEHKYGDLDWVAQRSMLINSFASIKRKKLINTMVANRVNEATAFGVATATVSKAATVSATPANASASRTDLPPFDAETDQAKLIYPIDSLCHAEILDYLITTDSACVAAVKETDQKKRKELVKEIPEPFPAMVESVANRYSSSGHGHKTAVSASSRDRQAALLQYLVHLSTVFRAQESGHHKLIKPHVEKHVPATVLSRILTQFASSVPEDRKKFVFSSSQRSKLMNYIGIIALTIADFSLEVNPLASFLKLVPSDLKNHLEQCGCKTVAKKEAHADGPEKDKDNKPIQRVPGAILFTATLSAPLKLPEFARRSSKR